MKSLFFVFILDVVTISFSFGQVVVPGNYAFQNNRSSCRIILHENHKFEYYDSTEFGVTTGRGEYSNVHEHLYLEFFQPGSDQLECAVFDENCDSLDYLTAKFKLLDNETKMPLSSARIRFIDPDNSLDTIQIITDSNGLATAMLDSREVIEFSFSCDGKNYHFEYLVNTCLYLNIGFWLQAPQTVSNGIVWQFKIKEVGSEGVVLRRNKVDRKFSKTQ